MKPKTLKFPFTWEKRAPFLGDQVFFVPDYYFEHKNFPLPYLFEKNQPISIEFCAGNGSWIAKKAQLEPHKNWIAIEMRFDRVQKIWSKAKNLGLTNLFVICGEALTFSSNYLSQGFADEIYINFPDPWEKNRRKDQKKRLINPTFAAELFRIGAKKSCATIVTDEPAYAKNSAFSMLEGGWKNSFPDPYFVTSLTENYGDSYFSLLWQSKGRNIHYLKFNK